MERNRKLLSQGFLSESEYEKSRAEFEASKTKLLGAESSLARAQADVKALASEVGKARVGLERTGLYAPFDGLVAFLNIERGAQVSPVSMEGMSEEQKAKAAQIVLVDPSDFEITLHMAPADARQVEAGQRCVVYRSLQELVGGFDGQAAIPATVYSVSPALTPGERLVQVKLRTTGEPKGLTDGMYVTAWIVVREKDDAVLLPSASLVLRDNKPLVYVVDRAASTVELRDISFGLMGISEYEAASGLKEGDLVVVQGKHRLADGVKVAITPGR
jgi:RND family efflux transporter MFP subunit